MTEKPTTIFADYQLKKEEILEKLNRAASHQVPGATMEEEKIRTKNMLKNVIAIIREEDGLKQREDLASTHEMRLILAGMLIGNLVNQSTPPAVAN